MEYTYSKNYNAEYQSKNILVRIWLKWEELVGRVIVNISRMPKQVRHDMVGVRRDPFSFFDMLKSTVRTRKKLAFSLVIFLLLGSIAYLSFRYLSPVQATQWWPDGGAAWSQRKQLTVTNNSAANLSSGTTVAITVNTKALYDTGKIQSDCDDVRVLYQPSSSTTAEITRHLVYPSGTTCTTSTTTKIYFKLQAALNAAVSSTDYYAYYGNGSASTPSSTDAAFNVGSATATLVCPFDGSTTCAAGETPSTESGAVRYSGSKNAMSFDGSNDSVSTASFTSSTTILTFETWVKFNALNHNAGYSGIMSQGGMTLAYYQPDNRIYIYLPSSSINYTATSLVTTGTWYHMAVVYDGSQSTNATKLKFYLNGVEQTLNFIGGVPSTTTGTGAATLGAYSSGYLNGLLDETRISDTKRYTTTFAPQTSPFVRDSNTKLLLHFDENGDDPRNTGKTIDDSANGNHGTITGAKYVAGLVGVDASTTDTGNVVRQSYTGHEGIVLEEGTTNKITNPSFENATAFNTNWNQSVQPDTVSGLQLWLKADAITGLNDGQAITTWTDSSSQSHNATQSTSGYKPIYKTNIINNQPVIRFDGTDDSMSVGTIRTGTGGVSAYVVSKRSSATGQDWQRTLSTWDGVTSDDYIVPNWIIVGAWNGSGNPLTYDPDVRTTLKSSGLAINNVTLGKNAQNGSQNFQGDIAEIIIYDNLISHSDQAGILAYLYSKYAITSITSNTTSPYYKYSSKSAKIIAPADTDSNPVNFTTAINPGSNNPHFLSAYIYNGTSGAVGGTVDSTVAQIVYDNQAKTTSYTDVGGGWWRLTYLGTSGADWWHSYSAGIGLIEEYPSSTQDANQGLFAASTNKYLSQGFQIGSTTNVNKVTLYIREVGNTTTYTRAEIQTDSSGVPSGTPVTNGTSGCAATNYLSSSFKFFTYGFASSVSLTANTQYHLVLKSFTDSNCTVEQSSADGTNYISWGYDSTSASYLGGVRATHNGTSWSSQAGTDHNFQIFASSNTSNFGVQVKTGKTVYVDGVQLGSGFGDAGELHITGYVDGSLGTGYSWTGTAHESTSTRAMGLLRYSSTNNISSSTGTVSFWLKAPYLTQAGSWSYSGMFFDSNISADLASTGVVIYRDSNGNLYCTHGSVSGNLGGMTNDAWIHVVATWNGNTFTCYKNGSQNTSGNSGQAVTIGSTIGVGSGDEYGSTIAGDSTMSDLRIWNAALDGTQVTDLYQSGLVSHSQGNELDRAGGFDSTSKGLPPIAIWHMDEGYGTTTYDSTKYGNNLTVSGATWNADSSTSLGMTRRNLKFDGSNDYLSRTVDGDFDFGTGSFTINGSFRHPSTVSGTDVLLARYGSAGYKVYMNSSGYLCFGTDYDSTWTPTDSACSTVSYADSKWHTFSAVKNGTTSLTLYVDGNSVGTDASLTASSINTGSNLYLGIDSDATSNPWDGFLDEIVIYPYARSAAQVKTDLYGNQSAVSIGSQTKDNLSDGLVGYWKMDESSWTVDCSTSSVIDSSGNGHHGKACPNSSGPTGGATGKFGTSGSFDGIDDYTQVNSTTALEPTSAITVSMWMKRNGAPGDYQYILSKEKDGGSGSYAFYINGGLRFYVTTSQYYLSSASSSVWDNAWHHIVGIYDGKYVYLYVDGSLVGTPAVASGSITYNSSHLYFGKYGVVHAGNILAGTDEIRIYNRALSPAEVSQLYNFAPGPVGHWKMDERTGTNAYDSSGSGNNGTISGATWINGKFGSGTEFSGGDSDQVNVSSITNIPVGAAPRTMSAWVKTQSGSYDYTNETVISWGNQGGTGYESSFGVGNTYLGFSAAWCSTTSSAFSSIANQWAHVAMVFNGSSTIYYLNGIKISSSSQTCVNTASGTNLRVGNTAFNSRSFKGQIDDARIYNYARTQKQIVEDMNAGHPAGGSPVGSAIGYYKFDEGTDNTCSGGSNDVCNTGSGGSSLNGAQTNMAVPATSTSGWTRDGKFGKGLNFDGTNDYIDLGSGTTYDFQGQQFSISGWFKLNDFPSGSDVCTRKYPLAANWDYGWAINVLPTQKIQVYRYYTASNSYSITSNTVLQTGQWYHFTVTQDASNLSLYINGAFDKSTAATDLTNYYITDDNPRIGQTRCGGVTYYYKGAMDEVKFYTSGLTSDEVKLDYNHGASMVLGSTGTTSAGVNDNSSSREYCIPGDNSTCNAPVAEWNLSESTGQSINDTSGNNNTGTLGATSGSESSDPAWTPTGKIGNGLSFDGSDDYVFGTAAFTISTTSDWTVGGWVNINANATGADTIVAVSENSTNYIFLHAINQSNDVGWRIAKTGNTERRQRTTNARLTKNTWHYVTVTKSGNNDVRVYIDGVEDTSRTDQAYDSVPNVSNKTWLGRIFTADVSLQFYGLIDNVKIYNYARTAGQIAWDYNRGAPQSHWRFDDCSGTTALDSSGNGYTGTLAIGASGSQTSAGTCSSGTGTEAWNNGSSGKFNASLNFDGTDDYVSVGTSAIIPTTSTTFAISAWVKTTDTSGSIFGQYYSPNDFTSDTSHFMAMSNGYLVFDEYTPSGGGTTGTTVINDGSWHHVVVVVNGSSRYLYVDGKLDTTGTQETYSGGTPNAIWIGARKYTSQGPSDTYNQFAGQIDDVRVYSYPLTATQVKNIMNEGTATRFGPQTGTP